MTVDQQIVDLSLKHIVQRRIHADMWFQTVHAAMLAPYLTLQEIPPPDAPCITVVSVTGSLTDGFEWVVRATGCVDLNGVSRTMTGDITFRGNPRAEELYTGAYEGTLAVEWQPDPDGGRALEAAKLNAEASTVEIRGTWQADANLEGFVEGVAIYATGAARHVDELFF